MNISLPDSLRDFIDDQVGRAGYGTSSEYVRELIRRDQERVQLRALLVEGAQSPIAGTVGARYFAGLRQRIATSRSSPSQPRAKTAAKG